MPETADQEPEDGRTHVVCTTCGGRWVVDRTTRTSAATGHRCHGQPSYVVTGDETVPDRAAYDAAYRAALND